MKSIGLVILFAFLIGCVFFAKTTTSAPKIVTVQKPVYIEKRIEVPVRVEVKKRMKVPARAKVAKRVKAPVEKKVEVQNERRVVVGVPPSPPPVMSAPVYTAIPQPIPVPQVNPIRTIQLLQNRSPVIVWQGSHFTTARNGIIPSWTGARCGIPRVMVRTHR
ncbi:MAG: hypothetical protein ABSF52_21990 [Syntrophobacteraceae bacterium]|jgi:hypothetical protein